MKGVIFAGARGARLDPLNEITDERLPPACKEPMVWHLVKQLTRSGFGENKFVRNPRHPQDRLFSIPVTVVDGTHD